MNTARRQTGIALLFLAPNLLGFLAFTLGPIVFSLGGSFTTWSLKPAVPIRFVGLANYADLFTDPNFYFYLFNTLYMLLALPFGIAGSLALAVFLTQKLDFRRPRNRRLAGFLAVGFGLVSAALLFVLGSPSGGFIVLALAAVTALGVFYGSIAYRTFYYLPCFTAGAGTMLLWMQLYNPSFGLINQAIGNLNHFLGWSLPQPGWLTSTRCLLGFLPLPASFNNGGFGLGAREAIMIMTLWGSIGGNNMVLYLAGISNISPELYEAAEVDGANAWQRFWFITLPQLAPTTFFLVVIGLIGGLQGGFEQARLMTEGGPAGTTTTLSYYIYSEGFERLNLGFASAVAWVLFAITMVITLINWRYGNRQTDS